MKDIKDFSKLFNVNIPVEKYFQYYLDTLIRAGDTELQHKIDLYNAHEQIVPSMYDEKMRWFGKIIQIIQDTEAYRIIKDYDVNKYNEPFDLYKIPQVKDINQYLDGDYQFISFDIVSANYQTMKLFDTHDELEDNWDNFLIKHEVPEVFRISKSFRQYIFGNLNPKKYGKIQSMVIERLYQLLVEKTDILPDLVMKSNDELVFVLPINEDKTNIIFNYYGQITSTFLSKEFKYLFGDEVIFKKSTYNLNKIGKNKYIKTDGLYKDKKTLLGIEGNLFYLYLKKYILEEEPMVADMMFTNDGRIAQWLDYEV